MALVQATLNEVLHVQRFSYIFETMDIIFDSISDDATSNEEIPRKSHMLQNMEEIVDAPDGEEAITNEEIQKKNVSMKSMKFDQEWVQVLINLRMKYSKLFTRRRNSASDGWKLVYEELRASGAPCFITIAKIKKKWMNLMTRFRQIKNSALSPDRVTWPYFDQMNRAFGKNSPITDEPDKNKNENSLLNAINNDERQNFIKRLIELRHSHKHLFTGRKYTARDGWIIIRSLLQCDEKYSVEQLSKCWQNLVQRYKQLAKSETTITWPYYQLMNNWHREENNINDFVKTEAEGSVNNIENEDVTDGSTPEKERGQGDKKYLITPLPAIHYANLKDILVHLTKMDELQEVRHKEIVGHLQQIQEILKNVANCKCNLY